MKNFNNITVAAANTVAIAGLLVLTIIMAQVLQVAWTTGSISVLPMGEQHVFIAAAVAGFIGMIGMLVSRN
jgi:hypothetical protein